ncbi:hypothetical protein [Sulfitobacter marinus]|uniref:hypothetical protein n=1 Tax=Sulfitobacter marinus TaxID=394264 RepID=UPI0011146624|nr:hypothetical protein [Sulfitobacter marinus]
MNSPNISDDDLDNRAFGGLVRLVGNHTSAQEHVALQELFLFRLCQAEREIRKTAKSNHSTLEAISKAQPLLQLLDDERLRAKDWAVAASERELKLVHYGEETIPKEIHLIYAYRRYHMNRRENFPLFNQWGEPWGKASKVNCASKTVSAAA